MELSMWMLADALKDTGVTAEITEGKRLLRGVRIGSGPEHTAVLTEDGAGNVLCSHGKDRLIFPNGDLAAAANMLLNVFDRYDAWETETRELIRSGCNGEVLAAHFGRLLGLSLFLADATFYAYARYFAESDPQLAARESGSPDRLPTLDLMLAIHQQPDIRSPGLGPYYVDAGDAAARTVARNLFLESRHIGWVVAFSPDGPLTPGQMQLVDVLGEWAEAYHRSNSTDISDLERTSLFADIIDGKPTDPAAVEKRLKLWGWHSGDEKLVYVLRGSGSPAAQEQSFWASVLRQNTFRFTYQDLLLLLVDLSLTGEQDMDEALLALARRGDVRIGKSRPFTDIFCLREQLQIAQLAMEYTASGAIGTLETAALPYAGALLREHAKADLRHPALAVLRAYDAAHGAELEKTLYVLLQNERSYAKTSGALHIHRSTLLYRIGRIAELTALDLDDPDTRLHLLLSGCMDRHGK